MKKRTDNTPARRAWEKFNGRKLNPGMHIHHIDGDCFNNDPKNLLAITAREHYNIHLQQRDYAACIRLSKAANIDPKDLYEIQKQHGLNCIRKKVGIHSDDFDHSLVSKHIWSKTPPGRKPVTDGIKVYKFKTDDEIEVFLKNNNGWKRGLPDSHKEGLSLSKRRLTSEESSKIAIERLANGTHNFTQNYICPHCYKKGKGPMMKRWHFDNCKLYKKYS